MKKQQIITYSILVVVILLIIVLFFIGGRKTVLSPIVDNGTVPTNLADREIQGNRNDLVSFSILPNTVVHGVMSYRGIVKNAYFFENNILINILDANKNILRNSNASGTTDWMTAGPVNFEGNIDFSGLPVGEAYIEIHNDNASGLPENDKSILIPIIIE